MPDQVSVNKNRWFYGAIMIAVLNPIFAGLVLGTLLWLEPGFKKEGRVVTLFSLAWGLIALLLAAKYGIVKP